MCQKNTARVYTETVRFLRSHKDNRRCRNQPTLEAFQGQDSGTVCWSSAEDGHRSSLALSVRPEATELNSTAAETCQSFIQPLNCTAFRLSLNPSPPAPWDLTHPSHLAHKIRQYWSDLCYCWLWTLWPYGCIKMHILSLLLLLSRSFIIGVVIILLPEACCASKCISQLQLHGSLPQIH